MYFGMDFTKNSHNNCLAAGVHSDNGDVDADCTTKRMLMPSYRELQIPLPIKVAFVLITMLFFATLLGFSFVIHDIRNVSNKNLELSAKNEILNQENKKRINDIQHYIKIEAEMYSSYK
jgi:hypothetical protein